MIKLTDNLDEVQSGIEQWSGVALGHLIRRGATPEEAEEILQEVCLTALQKRAQFQSGTNFRAWFFSIVYSRRADFFRNRKRQQTKHVSVSIPEEIAGAIGIDDLLLDLSDELDALQKCLEQKNSFQEAVKLRYLEQLPPREIAVRLGIPAKTASTRIHRGIEQLKQCIERKVRL